MRISLSKRSDILSGIPADPKVLTEVGLEDAQNPHATESVLLKALDDNNA